LLLCTLQGRCRCKFRRKETILIEASRNCGRVTEREAGLDTAVRGTRTGSEATPQERLRARRDARGTAGTFPARGSK